MKEYKKLFREAPRLRASQDLWRRIASESDLSSGTSPSRARLFTPMRAAAALVLAVGLAGLAYLRTHPRPDAAAAAAMAASAPADIDAVDAELLAWHAGLGEIDWTSEEEFPFTLEDEGESL